MTSAFETAEAIRSRRVSAREVVAHYASVIERREPGIHALVAWDRDRALAEAERVDERLSRGGDLPPLAGVPIAIKDNICTREGVTTCCSRMLDGYRSPYDAHVVERLKATGMIVLAKTNLDEFAMGSSTEHSCGGVTRNPWDGSRVAGGSSGGSAAAVCAGMVPWALGSDTGGSVRLPAAFTGVVGLKPTYGRVSRYGLVAFGSSLDQIGPLARDARDAALLLSVIAGHDGRDATCVDRPVPDYVAGLDEPLAGLRIGVVTECFGAGVEGGVASAVRSALEVYRGLGAELVNVHVPTMAYAVACYYIIATAEASSNLARFDGVHYGRRAAGVTDIQELYTRSREEGFGAEVKRRILLGTFVLSSGYYDAYYLKAQKVRTLIRRDLETAFAAADVLASPVSPFTAFRIGEKLDDPMKMYLADVFTVSANLAGVPAVSIPCGFDGAGMPVGLQLTAAWFEEGRLLRAAHQFQKATDFHRRRPID